jgi:glycosyltransferase involved in cell wall biosynthesis
LSARVKITRSRSVATARSKRPVQIKTRRRQHSPETTQPPQAISGTDPVRRRKVLIIASRFPPVASVGATRVRKFVKFLPEFGWDPIVITGAARKGDLTLHDARRASDFDSLADLPSNVPVHRLEAVLDHWPTYLARAAGKRLAPWTSALGIDERRWCGALKWRFEKLHNALAFPDRGIWRLTSTARLALRLHRQHRFDAIFSTGMPFSDHVTAMVIQSLIRRPWLADFRDPWVEYIHWQQWQSESGRRLTSATESAVIRRATFVISVNDPMMHRFSARYRGVSPRKFVTIANGYDPADFPTSAVTPPSIGFRMLYAGSLYGARTPQTMLAAFRKFLDETPGSRRHAYFDFAGRPGPHVDQLLRESDDGNVRYLGMLPHGKTLEAMAHADVNVIILPNLPGSANDSTAKLYECLGSGRAILAAVPLDGAAANELGRFDGVKICDPDRVDQIAQAIGEYYQAWLSNDLAIRRPASALSTVTRRHQAEQLADLLDRAAAAQKGRSGVRV